MKPPSALNEAGADLWRWLHERYDLSGVTPLAYELCSLRDRLAMIQQKIEAARKGADSADLLRLVNAESKIQASFVRAWRVLGLAGEELPAGKKVR